MKIIIYNLDSPFVERGFKHVMNCAGSSSNNSCNASKNWLIIGSGYCECVINFWQSSRRKVEGSISIYLMCSINASKINDKMIQFWFVDFYINIDIRFKD